MNYRHAFHAGNFADVLKHAVLARILVRLAEKPQPFRVIDIHAGAGRYDLAGDEAARTGEWNVGIGRLRGAQVAVAARELLAPYLNSVAAQNLGSSFQWYPGSPLIALHLMRRNDRLIACELHPEAAAALTQALRGDARAKAIEIDGWTALLAYIPPPERRGLVLIDPPFEDKDEFARLAEAVAAMHRKWPTGICLAWYPIKDASHAGLARRLRRSGIAKVLQAELQVAPPDAERLAACGLIVVNPPWRLDDELRVMLPALVSALAPSAQGRWSVDWLAGG
jgi:23S rRNA (adenine2030-N6)-methyltransferase